MKLYLALFIFLISFSFAKAQNTNISIDKNLNLTCAFEKVILKNPDHNFETFTKDQIKRDDINKLVIESKAPNVLNIKNLSNFIDKTSDVLNFGDSHVVIKWQINREIKNGNPNAITSIIIFWLMYSDKIVFKSVKKWNDIIIENIQENKLKISLTKPLNAATIEDIKIIDITIISIPL